MTTFTFHNPNALGGSYQLDDAEARQIRDALLAIEAKLAAARGYSVALNIALHPSGNADAVIRRIDGG